MMIITAILGLDSVEVVNFYLVSTLRGLVVMTSPFSVLPSCFTLLPILSLPSSQLGGPSGGSRLPKSLCESGSEHEKNVRRPRAEAVVPRKGLSEALVCIVNYFPWYEVLRLSCEANRINCYLRFKLPCSRLAKVT